MTETSRRIALSGARAAVSLPAWIVGFSFLGVGSLVRDAGHPIGAAILSTVLIFAAPAQLILYGTLADGGLVVAAALAVGFSAIRLLPMTLGLLPYLRRPGQAWLERWALAHMVAATTWMESMRRLPLLEPEARVPFYIGFALTCMTISATMTGLGYILVNALPVPLAAALMLLTPIYFTIGMVVGAGRPGDWIAIAAGLTFMPVAQAWVGRDFDIVVTGLLGGTAAFLIDRALRVRARPDPGGTA